MYRGIRGLYFRYCTLQAALRLLCGQSHRTQHVSDADDAQLTDGNITKFPCRPCMAGMEFMFGMEFIGPAAHPNFPKYLVSNPPSAWLKATLH